MHDAAGVQVPPNSYRNRRCDVPRRVLASVFACRRWTTNPTFTVTGKPGWRPPPHPEPRLPRRCGPHPTRSTPPTSKAKATRSTHPTSKAKTLLIKSVITDQDTPGYTVDPVVITKVEELASQTHHGAAHVNRWQRVLVAFGVLDAAGVQGGAITVAEAQENANRYSSPVWNLVVTELTNLQASQ